jgi:hypothetical protein
MTTIDLFVDDSDIDVPINDREEGEQRALQLAHAIRVVASSDPEYAQSLVDELITALDVALEGRFRHYYDAATRQIANRGANTESDLLIAGISPARNS